ncbi:MAG: hypothetical protein ACK4QP_12810 [Pseudorhizobium sp.]
MGGAQGNTTTATGLSADNSQMAANDVDAVEIGDGGLPDRIILRVTREPLKFVPVYVGVGAVQR